MSRKSASKFLHPRIYMDYAATTPIAPEVLKVMQKAEWEIFGNASSIHKEGVVAKQMLDEARRSIALSLSAHSDEIVLTSGGTEANNLALCGVVNHLEKSGKKLSEMHIVTSAIEHSSILEVVYELVRRGVKATFIPVNEKGIISVDDVLKALRPETVLVSIQYANNEIGTIQPILKLFKNVKLKIKNSNAKFPILHCDASQAPLYLDCSPNRLQADLVTLDAHKMYGPKGIGLLYIRRGVQVTPILFGGGQESKRRSTTENVPAVVGFAKACQLANAEREKEARRLSTLRDYAFSHIKKHFPNFVINGDEENRLPNNINISIPGINPEFTVLKLDAAGIACSTKSSCVSGEEMSYVVKALGADDERAKGTLRFTLGKYSSKKDIQKLIRELFTL